MGEILEAQKVMLFCGVMYRPDIDIAAVRARLEAEFGPVAEQSDVFNFDMTDYYEPEMGPGILKTFFAFENLIGQDDILAIKLITNSIESEYASSDGATSENNSVKRTVNLDPGFVSLAKVVLPTTKDNFHRIYLGKGIYAEITLMFREKTFRPFEWTFPDFRKEEYISFLNELRRKLRDRLKKEKTA